MATAADVAVLTKARQLIAQQEFNAAIEALVAHVDGRQDVESHALLGMAYFQSQQYAEAEKAYGLALQQDPANADLQAMHQQARENTLAEVNVFVPELYYFDREKLLAKASVPEGALPTPLPPTRPNLFNRMRIRLGNAIGVVASVLMGSATRIYGRLAGYRDTVWTNWYRRPFVFAILTLAYMREQLNTHNLKNTYPKGTLTGFQPQGETPPPGVTHFRTADGTWNNLDDPKEGAAFTRFMRNVTNGAVRPERDDELLSPNPRELSRIFLTRHGEMQEVPFLNMLAASWIQFQNHDWINHGEVVLNDVIAIPLAEDDPARRRHWQTHMFIGKTQPDPTWTPGQEETPITFINEVTHWWDASQIYGSDQATQDRLRSGVDGKLRLNPDGTLPRGDKGIEETGFVRNWWVGLSMLHTLFAREHNAICDHLKAAYPDWDDNRLFNVARLINAAVIAKIHSVEWTPAILPNMGLDAGLNANWYGLLTNLLRTGKGRKTVADINVRNPEMGGVVGNPIDKHGQPYGLTEEFVEVYRLHSLLPETLKIRHLGESGPVTEIPFPETRQAGSAKLTSHTSMADLFYSFGNQHPGQLVLNNFPRFMQEMSIPGNPLFDMGAVDILRARERGVPRYNEFRRQLGLNPIRSFDDLCIDGETVDKLKAVYGDRPEDVERLDLMIGTLAESFRPSGFGFGETMFQIFILNASRRLQADRFYTDSYNEDVYTKEGMEWIDLSDLKSVILRHYPELAGSGLANVKNAFEPWDTDERLDPARHPLRQYDKELKANPWLGDAYR